MDRLVAARDTCPVCASFAGRLCSGWGLGSEPPPLLKAWMGEESATWAVEMAEYILTRLKAAREDRDAVRIEHPDGTATLLGAMSSELEVREAVQGRGGRPIPPYVRERWFPARSRGRPPLVPGLTPEALHLFLENEILPTLSHWEAHPVDPLEPHLEEVFGSRDDWPPHLGTIVEILRAQWTRQGRELTPARKAYRRRAIGRRVLLAVPMRREFTVEIPGRSLVDIQETFLELTPAQLRELDKPARWEPDPSSSPE